ncbi:hypothetical protein CWI38_0343p0020 [Hamiltosporidium tvaerminnensis]|uniref:Uncharacterized protein n=2 Tax=Hamiltosporidium tvaerminnensis TaxID=1176355 RepID=A0A4Q9M0N1_9MICR|nr:hypothetical protein CWI38_0343p0020 [Hamiltosporidium tvaerminnensis]
MIKLIKNGDIVFEIQEDFVDPLTFDSYPQIIDEYIKNEKEQIFAMLLCTKKKFVYLSESIINLRYDKCILGEPLTVYLLDDPISRLSVTDIEYYILKNKIDGVNFIAVYLCNEVELYTYSEFRTIVFKPESPRYVYLVLKIGVMILLLFFAIMFISTIFIFIYLNYFEKK